MKMPDCMFLCHVHVSNWTHTLWLPECQGTPCPKQAWNLKFTWLQRNSNPQPLSSLTNTQPFSYTGPWFLNDWLWLNGWVFVYELSGCGFGSRCSHENATLEIMIIIRKTGSCVLVKLFLKENLRNFQKLK